MQRTSTTLLPLALHATGYSVHVACLLRCVYRWRATLPLVMFDRRNIYGI
jgi:hypothetical protein